MVKKFNDVGLCFPEEHFMGDIRQKVATMYRMVEEGAYFIINRPRQYGKTTLLHTITRQLAASDTYMPFRMSFEGMSDKNFLDEAFFAPSFIRLMAKSARTYAPDKQTALLEAMSSITNLDALSDFISDFIENSNKKVVLLIDEVDKSSNNQLFINFLAMLRDKYLDRKDTPTFHAVILAGVHDVKSLKLKLRPDSEAKYNSPWNIATTFSLDLNLSIAEIKPMLDDYVQERGVKMDPQWVAERLFFLTSGYPYLVSKLCKIIDEDILPTKTVKEWTPNDLNKAVQRLMREPHNANFDTLMKNLENYSDLYHLVFTLIFGSDKKTFNQLDPLISLGVLHGILASSEEGYLMVHNRIYREVIANMMMSKWETSQGSPINFVSKETDFKSSYKLPNNGLNMEKLLSNFQVFMRQNRSNKQSRFLESDGTLLFLAFLRPILNGSGFEFKEPQISDEKRLDIVITYNQFKYITELKVWYGLAAHEKGLQQLADYLDRQDLDTGYLLIFDHSKKKKWTKEWEEVNGKRVLCVWV